MKSFLNIFKREVAFISGDLSIILTIIGAPLLYSFFLGSIYMFKDVEKNDFALVDMDHTATSRQIGRFMGSSQKINLKYECVDYTEAVDKLYRLDVQGFLIIPKGFEANLKKGEGSDVRIFLNTSRFLPSNDINKGLTNVFLTVGAGVRLKYYQASGLTYKYAMENAAPVLPEIHSVYNVNNNYGDFLLPGLFLLILQQTLLIGLGESIADERKHKNIGKWIAMAGGNVFKAMHAKGLFYILHYFAMTFFFLVVVFHAFNVSIGSQYLYLALISFVFIMAVFYYTMFFSSFFKTPGGLMEFYAFTTYPIFLVTGYSWPKTEMPLILQWIADSIPTTPFFNAFLEITQQNTPADKLNSYLIHLLILAVAGMIASHLRLDYLRKKSGIIDLAE